MRQDKTAYRISVGCQGPFQRFQYTRSRVEELLVSDRRLPVSVTSWFHQISAGLWQPVECGNSCSRRFVFAFPSWLVGSFLRDMRTYFPAVTPVHRRVSFHPHLLFPGSSGKRIFLWGGDIRRQTVRCLHDKGIRYIIYACSSPALGIFAVKTFPQIGSYIQKRIQHGTAER